MKRSFAARCYELCRMVPCGCVTTYKEIAAALGCRSYRAVGNAMNKNPFAPQVPCHRIVRSDGALGGFAQGAARKKELLEKEGIKVHAGKVIDFEKRIFHLTPFFD